MKNLALFFKIKELLAHPIQQQQMRLRALFAKTKPFQAGPDQAEYVLAVYLEGFCIWRKFRVIVGNEPPVDESQLKDELMGEVLLEAAARGFFITKNETEKLREVERVSFHSTPSFWPEHWKTEHELLPE